MALAVIGAGLPRTGTESLKRALELLGFGPCYHMVELIDHPEHLPCWESAPDGDWLSALDGYRSAVDFPAMVFWKVLAERSPAAKIILSTRDAASWYESIRQTVLAAAAELPEHDPQTRRRRLIVRRLLIAGLFENRADDAGWMQDRFARHADEVRAALPAERLLEFEATDGWPPLCRFLGVPEPDVRYPRGNDTASFRRRYLGRD